MATTSLTTTASLIFFPCSSPRVMSIHEVVTDDYLSASPMFGSRQSWGAQWLGSYQERGLKLLARA